MDNQLSERAGESVNKGGVFCLCITRPLSLVLSDAVSTRMAEPCQSRPHIRAFWQSRFFPSSSPPRILHSSPSVLLRLSSNLLLTLALYSVSADDDWSCHGKGQLWVCSAPSMLLSGSPFSARHLLGKGQSCICALCIALAFPLYFSPCICTMPNT